LKKKVTGWLHNTDSEKVDIMPRGEEDRHIPVPECECLPRLSQDTQGRQMIIHKSFDGCEGFELFVPTRSAARRRMVA
jgi:hypothetical protein